MRPTDAFEDLCKVFRYKETFWRRGYVENILGTSLKATVLRIICICIILISFLSDIVGQEDLNPRKSWMVDNRCGVPVEIGLESRMSTVDKIFLYLEPKFFTQEALKHIFLCYSRKYHSSVLLDIVAFSDKPNLEIAIRNRFKPPPDVNPPLDTSKTDCADLKNAVRPCPTGYFRAFFVRQYFVNSETIYFEYSPNPKKIERIRVELERSYVDDSWRNIIPLQTTRTQVEKMLGGSVIKKSKTPTQTFDAYKTGVGSFKVWYYSSGKCGKKDSPQTQIAARAVVTKVLFQPAQAAFLQEWNLNVGGYQKQRHPKFSNRFFYNSPDGALVIETIVKNGEIETVWAITRQPSVKDKGLLCDTPEN